MLTLADADAELHRLAILKKNHDDEQYVARRSKGELPQTIARQAKRVRALSTTWPPPLPMPATRSSSAAAPTREDGLAILGNRLNGIPDATHDTRRVPLGTYHGLAFGIELHPYGGPEVFLEGEITRHGPLARDAGPRTVVNALDRLIGTYEAQADTARQDLAISQGQLRDYEARLGKPIAHDAYRAELTALRDQLRSGLSDAAPNRGRSRFRRSLSSPSGSRH